MKRIFTFLLALCVYTIASAQIQTNFLGLKLSGYYDIGVAKRVVIERCGYASVGEDNTILTYDVNFGGYIWDAVFFSFYKGHSSYALRSITFMEECSDRDSVADMWVSLKNKLDNKYGSHEIIPSENLFIAKWDDLENNSCRLCSDKSANKENKWFIMLTYSDEDLEELYEKQKDDEL